MGEKPSLDGFCREYVVRLGRFFLSRGVPAQDVDDLVEETFVVFLSKRFRILDGKRQAFLFGTAANVLKAYQRKALLTRLRHDDRASTTNLAAEEETPADATAELHELVQLLEKAVSELPPRMQEVMRLVYIEGKSCSEAARAMKITRWTVYEAKKRALEHLRSYLRRNG